MFYLSFYDERFFFFMIQNWQNEIKVRSDISYSTSKSKYFTILPMKNTFTVSSTLFVASIFNLLKLKFQVINFMDLRAKFEKNQGGPRF